MNDTNSAVSQIGAMKAQAAELEASIKSLQVAAKAELKASLEAQAKSAGYTLSDLFGGRVPSRRLAKGKPWINPNDASQVWAGIGKRPGWLTSLLAEGYTQEQFQA